MEESVKNGSPIMKKQQKEKKTKKVLHKKNREENSGVNRTEPSPKIMVCPKMQKGAEDPDGRKSMSSLTTTHSKEIEESRPSDDVTSAAVGDKNSFIASQSHVTALHGAQVKSANQHPASQVEPLRISTVNGQHIVECSEDKSEYGQSNSAFNRARQDCSPDKVVELNSANNKQSKDLSDDEGHSIKEGHEKPQKGVTFSSDEENNSHLVTVTSDSDSHSSKSTTDVEYRGRSRSVTFSCDENNDEADAVPSEVSPANESSPPDDFLPVERPRRRSSFGLMVSSALQKVDLMACEPGVAVSLLTNMSNLKVCAALKQKLKGCTNDWIEGFINEDGVNRLLDMVKLLTSARVSQLSDAMLLLECVECIRAVMNNQQGLEFFIHHKEATQHLIGALDTNNTMVKRQIVQLMTALSRFSMEGYNCCLQSFEYFKALKKQRYRFSILVNELKSAELPAYKSALLLLINCLVIGHETSKQSHRNVIRNEFVGLNILDLVYELRGDPDEDVCTQCDTFLELMEEDDSKAKSESLSSTHLGAFNAVFTKVCSTPNSESFLTVLHYLESIADSAFSDEIWDALMIISLRLSLCERPSEIEKLLYAFRHPELVEAGRDYTESILRRSVSRQQTLEDTNVDSEGLIIPTVSKSFSATSAAGSPIIPSSAMNCAGLGIPAPPPPPGGTVIPAPPPPPGGANIPTPPPPPGGANIPAPPLPPGGAGIPAPPPPPGGAVIPAPPPPPGGAVIPAPPPPPGGAGIPAPPPAPGSTGIPAPPPPPSGTGIPAPPPPPPSGIGIPAPPPPPSGIGIPAPPQPPGGAGIPAPPLPGVQALPFAPAPPAGIGIQIPALPGNFGAPSTIARRVSIIQTPTPNKKMKTYNWAKIQTRVLEASHDNVWEKVAMIDDRIQPDYQKVETLFCQQEVVKMDVANETSETKKTEEIALLDSRRSMNVNIFLKQFKMDNSRIVDLLREGDPEKIGQERLLGLIKILPSQDEVDILKAFDGDESKLGNAEKFFRQLIKLSDYKLILELLILKMEFPGSSAEINRNLGLYQQAIHDTMKSTSLDEFLRLVLCLGNFINTGKNSGNASGFKISSLLKLMDTKANSSRVTLLHYIVEEASNQDKHVLDFVNSLSPVLKDLSRTTLDGVQNEFNTLKGKLSTLSTRLDQSDKQVKLQFCPFILAANEETRLMSTKLTSIQDGSEQLANFFCEEKKGFSVDEFLGSLQSFLDKVVQCQKDNEQRRVQEERAEKRKLEREKSEMKKKNSVGSTNSLASQESNVCLVDMLLGEIRRGTQLRTVPEDRT